ncbi:MAG TPA: hypothetical protein ACHBX0_03065 [Arsenophonus sp.]
MPDLESYLAMYLAQQSENFNVNNTTLDDRVEFCYKAYSFIPEVGAANKRFHPPIQKFYTVRKILLGRERKWLSENPHYKLDEVLTVLYPSQYTKQLIREINSANIQNSYIDKMKVIKQDSDIKNTFCAFLEHVLTTYGKKNDLYYLIENSPLLLVFPDED